MPGCCELHWQRATSPHALRDYNVHGFDSYGYVSEQAGALSRVAHDASRHAPACLAWLLVPVHCYYLKCIELHIIYARLLLLACAGGDTGAQQHRLFCIKADKMVSADAREELKEKLKQDPSFKATLRQRVKDLLASKTQKTGTASYNFDSYMVTGTQCAIHLL